MLCDARHCSSGKACGRAQAGARRYLDASVLELMLKKVVLHSVATALASMVLPASRWLPGPARGHSSSSSGSEQEVRGVARTSPGGAKHEQALRSSAVPWLRG